jgi:GTP-binding protein HflX
MHHTIVAFFQRDLIEAEIFLPWTAQQWRGKIYASCQVLEERSDNEGAYIKVLGEAVSVKNLREQVDQTTVYSRS